MDRDFVATLMLLDRLSSIGYEEAWIACDNPHWSVEGRSNGLVASPPRRNDGWPSLWRLEGVGELSCGNAFPNADNGFFRWIAPPMKGHYVRNSDGQWHRKTLV